MSCTGAVPKSAVGFLPLGSRVTLGGGDGVGGGVIMSGIVCLGVRTTGGSPKVAVMRILSGGGREVVVGVVGVVGVGVGVGLVCRGGGSCVGILCRMLVSLSR